MFVKVASLCALFSLASIAHSTIVIPIPFKKADSLSTTNHFALLHASTNGRGSRIIGMQLNSSLPLINLRDVQGISSKVSCDANSVVFQADNFLVLNMFNGFSGSPFLAALDHAYGCGGGYGNSSELSIRKVTHVSTAFLTKTVTLYAKPANPQEVTLNYASTSVSYPSTSDVQGFLTEFIQDIIAWIKGLTVTTTDNPDGSVTTFINGNYNYTHSFPKLLIHGGNLTSYVNLTKIDFSIAGNAQLEIRGKLFDSSKPNISVIWRANISTDTMIDWFFDSNDLTGGASIFKMPQLEKLIIDLPELSYPGVFAIVPSVTISSVLYLLGHDSAHGYPEIQFKLNNLVVTATNSPSFNVTSGSPQISLIPHSTISNIQAGAKLELFINLAVRGNVVGYDIPVGFGVMWDQVIATSVNVVVSSSLNTPLTDINQLLQSTNVNGCARLDLDTLVSYSSGDSYQQLFRLPIELNKNCPRYFTD